MRSLICLLAIIGSLSTLATPPVLSNVRASQREGTKLVDIYYDAEDADGDILKVRIEVSDNDGVKYSVPAKTFTGDIGENITPGTNKHIVWDAGTDWDGEYSDKMRVKVFAIDARGFPGMEWSNEIPPGGFLLGQDGGAEGSGESQHVNIPWSYWVAKYEVTNEQYCDFLNAAYVSGYIGLNGSTNVYATATMPANFACPPGEVLCFLGDNRGVRWNVNNFEPVAGSENIPVVTTWFGAMAFCRFYGYDLPTEAEWEKAARGPDNDDQDEHLKYPWGDVWSSTMANENYFSLKPVDTYDQAIAGYGLCCAMGNVAEWTRSICSYSISVYPTQEDLTHCRNSPFYDEERVVKGLGNNALYCRFACDAGSDNFYVGFRPIRRQAEVRDVRVALEIEEDFDTLEENACDFSHNGLTWTVNNTGSHDQYKLFRTNVGIGGSPGIGWSDQYRTYYTIFIPQTTGRLAFIRLKVKNTGNAYTSVYISGPAGPSSAISLDPRMTTFVAKQLPIVDDSAVDSIHAGSGYVYIDEIELWTISE